MLHFQGLGRQLAGEGVEAVVCLLGGGLDEGHELIASETDEQLEGLQILLQLAAHQLEQFVAEVVTKAVIQQLEMVKVEEGQAQR
jgi:hypothetical protein